MSKRIDVQCYVSRDRVVINIVPEDSLRSVTLDMSVAEAEATAKSILIEVNRIKEEWTK